MEIDCLFRLIRPAILYRLWYLLIQTILINSDGINKKLVIEKPFYTLDYSWSSGIRLIETEFVESLEAFGQDIESFDHIDNNYQVYAGYSKGLSGGFTRRYSFGFTRDEDIFKAPDNPPTDRILSYPWAKYSIIEDNFSIYRNLDVLYRTEDVPVGLSLSTLLGYADESYNSELSQWVFPFAIVILHWYWTGIYLKPD